MYMQDIFEYPKIRMLASLDGGSQYHMLQPAGDTADVTQATPCSLADRQNPMTSTMMHMVTLVFEDNNCSATTRISGWQG